MYHGIETGKTTVGRWDSVFSEQDALIECCFEARLRLKCLLDEPEVPRLREALHSHTVPDVPVTGGATTLNVLATQLTVVPMTGDPNETDPEAGESSVPDESSLDDENSPADDPFGNPYPEADREDPFGDPSPENDRSQAQSGTEQPPEDTRDAVSDGSGVEANSPRDEKQPQAGPASGPRSDKRHTTPRQRPRDDHTNQHSAPNRDWTARLGNRRESARQRAPSPSREERRQRHSQTRDTGFDRSWSAGGSQSGRHGRRGFDREPRQGARGGTRSDRTDAASDGRMSTVFSELRAIESSAPKQTVSKPYLQRIPDGYDAELSVMEWIRALVETAGYDATLDALAYYESIGWISTGVQHTLEEHAATIAGSTPGGDRTLTLDDHRRSLRAIARIARSGA